MANRNRNDNAYSIGAASSIDPLYMVASQLKTLTADGIATLNVSAEKIMLVIPDCPDVNMWWPHTRNENSAMAIDDHAMNR